MNATSTTQIEIKNATIAAVKADFVKREVRLTVSFTLNDDALALREQLAFLAFDESPISLSLQPMQLKLADVTT